MEKNYGTYNLDIIDLIVNNSSQESLNYIKSIVGDDEQVRNLFKDETLVKDLIDNVKDDIKFLQIFHQVYISIKDDPSLNNSCMMNCLIRLDIAYHELLKDMAFKNVIKRKTNILPENQMISIINDRIGLLYSIESLNDQYIYKDEAIEIYNDKELFSLEKEFDENQRGIDPYDLNAVTIITPTQTISRFCDQEKAGFIGSGYHEANFEKITKAAYGKRFNNSVNGQDIKIRYVNSLSSSVPYSYLMTVEMPLTINSSQKQSLIFLNNEILKFERETGHNININIGITDYIDKNYYQELPLQTNLNDVFNNIIIDDTMDIIHPEIVMLGYSNYENHFNDINSMEKRAK